MEYVNTLCGSYLHSTPILLTDKTETPISNQKEEVDNEKKSIEKYLTTHFSSCFRFSNRNHKNSSLLSFRNKSILGDYYFCAIS